MAWIAPFAVFGAALLGTILLIRRWGGLGGKSQAAIASGRGGCSTRQNASGWSAFAERQILTQAAMEDFESMTETQGLIAG